MEGVRHVAVGIFIVLLASCVSSESQLDECSDLLKDKNALKESFVDSITIDVAIESQNASIALAKIDEMKHLIHTKSRNAADPEIVAMFLFVDASVSRPFYQALRKTEFAQSKFAQVKYRGLDSNWAFNTFNSKTAAEAKLLLTELQLDILNHYMATKEKS